MAPKKYPSRDNIPIPPTEISKWQKASVELVELKFKVHNTLKQFSEEERQSDQYKELTDILRGIIVHVIDETHDTAPQCPAHPTVQPIQIIQNNTTRPVSDDSDTELDLESVTTSGKWKRAFSKFCNMHTLIIGVVTAAITALAPYIVDIIKAIVGAS